MENLISIIIPIYNKEKYLKRCIESVINQTYRNLEIILVNDGSTDNSIRICQEYEKKDKRIKIIDKENGGLSDARNKGLEIATGDYLGFVDGDDYIENDMYEILYNLCKKNDADISLVSFNNVIKGKIIAKYNTDKIKVYNRVEGLKELLIGENIRNYICNRLYKKELFKNLYFDVGKAFEDIPMSAELFNRSKKIVYREIPKYNYVLINNSISNVRSYNNCKDYFENNFERYKKFKDLDPQLNFYNDFAFVSSMLMAYRDSIVYDYKELYNEVDKKYELFLKIIEAKEEKFYKLLNNYRKVLFTLILWNKEKAKILIKKFAELAENI